MMERIIENVDEDTLDILTPKYAVLFVESNANILNFCVFFWSQNT